MLSDFTVKKHKIGKGNLHLTENRSSRSEMWCTADDHNDMYRICAKELLDSNFYEAVIDKILNFNEIALSFTHSKKLCFFFKYNWNFLDQLLLPYKFHGRHV